jgi:DNA (cytosine-5)-methyltransferase 1
MENTIIRNENDQSENILDCLGRRLHPLGYSIRSNIMDFSFYGVPHHRERLITIGCRIPQIIKNVPSQKSIFSKKLSVFHPPASHGINGCPSLISLRNAVGQLPTLDSQTLLVDPKDQLHRVPRWRDNQYFWMKNTPEGQSAFDNFVCIQCSHQNQTKESVTCEKCGEFLPRPTLIRNGEVRLIKGFKTSYRRMKWDSPASTLTMNSGVISSDIKGHPDQHRVLSLREILILSTLDHPRWKKEYSFEGIKYGRPQNEAVFSSKLIREVIGESIPPLAMSCLVNHLRGLE